MGSGSTARKRAGKQSKGKHSLSSRAFAQTDNKEAHREAEELFKRKHEKA